MKIFFVSILLFLQTDLLAQPKPFVPLEYEYPERVLKTPKRYVFKNADTQELRYKDIELTKKAGVVIINWNEFDASPVKDSSTEVADKAISHFITINGKQFQGIILEDSLYKDGSRLGEKVQSIKFKFSPAFELTAIIHSHFLKDTVMLWQGQKVATLVISSQMRQIITNKAATPQTSETISSVYYYFGKGIGLLKYTDETNGKTTSWELQEIKNRDN